ncbi:MAG: hypothetical protein ACRD4F_16050 [Candidatus Angelobacter sp.]
MELHDSVAAMAIADAEAAVIAAREYNGQLDYSEESLMELESILARFCGQQRGPEDISERCKIWGSYLGEVVRRRFGGEWSIDSYPGKQFATLTLTVNGSRIFPSMKVHRRLTQGEAENVWSFYKMIKSRLESLPSSGVPAPSVQ